MRIVLRSLDNLTASFVDPDVDDAPPLDTYAVPLPEGSGASHRFYDFEGTRRDDDAAGEVVRVYRERKPERVVREVEVVYYASAVEPLKGPIIRAPQPVVTRVGA